MNVIVALFWFFITAMASIALPLKMVSLFNLGRPDGKRIVEPNLRFLLDGWQLAVLITASVIAGLSAPKVGESVDFPTAIVLVCLLVTPIFLSLWKTYRHRRT